MTMTGIVKVWKKVTRWQGMNESKLRDETHGITGTRLDESTRLSYLPRQTDPLPNTPCSGPQANYYSLVHK